MTNCPRMVKFSSKLSPEALSALRALADESGKPLARVLDEAVREYVERARVRPAFLAAAGAALDEHAALLGALETP